MTVEEFANGLLNIGHDDDLFEELSKCLNKSVNELQDFFLDNVEERGELIDWDSESGAATFKSILKAPNNIFVELVWEEFPGWSMDYESFWCQRVVPERRNKTVYLLPELAKSGN